MSEQFEVIFFDKFGNQQAVQTFDADDEVEPETNAESNEIISYGNLGEAELAKAMPTEITICHVNGIPEIKTEIVYKKIKLPFGREIRVPTVAVRKRACNTDFVAIIYINTVAEGKLKPVLLECAVPAAAIAATIIIGGGITGAGAPMAIAAGLEAFIQSITACIALRGFQRTDFDVKLEQRKSCSVWEAVA